ARMADLAELAIDFAVRHLKGEGALLVKCFHGSGYSQIVEAFRRNFFEVLVRKPEASRSASAETYLLGRRPRRPLVGGSGACRRNRACASGVRHYRIGRACGKFRVECGVRNRRSEFGTARRPTGREGVGE